MVERMDNQCMHEIMVTNTTLSILMFSLHSTVFYDYLLSF